MMTRYEYARINPSNDVSPLKAPAVELASYLVKAGFHVTVEDARALANALERALPDVPHHDAVAHKAVTMASAPGKRFVPFGTSVNPFERSGGNNRAHLEAFVALYRQRGFEIS
jgi:hypothetical protein